MDLGDEEPLRVEPVGPVGPSETQGRESAAGLALSVILHGIALFLLLVVGVFGTEGSQGGLEIVPVEVEITNQSASAAAEGLDRHLKLRALRIEAPALGVRASHLERAGGDADHHRAFRAFLKFPLLAIFRMACGGPAKREEADRQGRKDASSHWAERVRYQARA